MRREGSAFQGLGTVFVKELSDNISSVRMLVLELLVVLTALAALYGAIDNLRQNTAEDPFLLLRLFTIARDPLPSFVAMLGFLVPLMAIGLGFDAVNSEHNRRTLSRILAQPIYRDALLMGKFLAGLATLGVSLAALWLMVIGLGLIFLGVPPGGEEIARSLVFLVVAIFYAGRLAVACDAALDRVPLARDRGAGRARRLAVPDRAVADAGARDCAGDRAARSALRRARAGDAGHGTVGAIPHAHLAERFVRGSDAGDPVAADTHARRSVPRAVARRFDGRAASLR